MLALFLLIDIRLVGKFREFRSFRRVSTAESANLWPCDRVTTLTCYRVVPYPPLPLKRECFRGVTTGLNGSVERHRAWRERVWSVSESPNIPGARHPPSAERLTTEIGFKGSTVWKSYTTRIWKSYTFHRVPNIFENRKVITRSLSITWW